MPSNLASSRIQFNVTRNRIAVDYANKKLVREDCFAVLPLSHKHDDSDVVDGDDSIDPSWDDDVDVTRDDDSDVVAEDELVDTSSSE